MSAYASLAGRTALALVAAAGATTGANAATLIVSNGILQGATGVNVDGTLYDVAFRDGTCAALFNGCNELSDFAFNTDASAERAAQALLDQVLIDGPLGQFDSQPNLVEGCSSPTTCGSFIPWGFVGSGAIQRVKTASNSGSNDGIRNNVTSPNLTTTTSSVLNFAVFSNARPLAAAVPEPGTWAMLILGFGAVGGAMRRRTVTAKTARMRLTYA